MKQSDIDRALILIYRSNNAHGWTNYRRPIDATDPLPMKGLLEYAGMLSNLRDDVIREMDRRVKVGEFKYPAKDDKANDHSLTNIEDVPEEVWVMLEEWEIKTNQRNE